MVAGAARLMRLAVDCCAAFDRPHQLTQVVYRFGQCGYVQWQQETLRFATLMAGYDLCGVRGAAHKIKEKLKMKHIDQTIEIVKNFTFKKHDYIGAKEQLSQFSDSYARLNLEEANYLRSIFKAKDRFGWLCVASTVFLELFPDANTLLKEELTKIFFAVYSFDNLDFGYDSVLYVIEVKKCMIEQRKTLVKNWALYAGITSSITAKDNLEGHLFAALSCPHQIRIASS
jgi:hypothetical protein